MNTFQYTHVYQSLRSRIEASEWQIGDRLPSISEIQDEYDIPSLGTVRAAQQMLEEDGLIRREQGRGAFITSTTAQRGIDVDDAIEQAIRTLRQAQAAHATQKIRRVTIDLDDPDHDSAYYVLTSLADYAAKLRSDIEEGTSNAPELDAQHATDAEWIVTLTEEALARTS